MFQNSISYKVIKLTNLPLGESYVMTNATPIQFEIHFVNQFLSFSFKKGK